MENLQFNSQEPKRDKSKILLIILLVVVSIALGYFIGRTQVSQSTNGVEVISENVSNTESFESEEYNSEKFGISFNYGADISLQSASFSVDALSSGRTYVCPWNGTQRMYTERDVTVDNIDTSNCTYDAPNIDDAALSQFGARWSPSVYGTEENIETLIIDGQPARLVYGTTDYRTIIVEFPAPYIENGYTYDFLILSADTLLMEDVIASLRF